MPHIACEVCGTLKYHKPTRIAAGYGRFCGGTCYGSQKQTRIEIVCSRDGCDKTRMVKPVDIKRGGGKYCGDPCARADRLDKLPSLHDRIWAKIQKTDTSWLWTGAKNSMGYGQFCLTKNPPVFKLASHYLWFEATGQWPERGQALLHTCDIPLCVRNDDIGTYTVNGVVLPRAGHLALGTQANNVADMVAKGRGRRKRADR